MADWDDWLGEWDSHVATQIARLKTGLAHQRHRLSFDLETADMEGRFSRALSELMRQEEVLIAREQVEAYRQTAGKVDAMMRTETRRIFNEQAQRALQRWQMLHHAQRGRVEGFVRDTSGAMQTVARMLGVPMPSTGFAPGAGAGAGGGDLSALMRLAEDAEDDFAQRVEDSDIAAKRAWAATERFNVQHAMAQQRERLEAEWEACFESMHAQYAEARAALGAPPAGASHHLHPHHHDEAGSPAKWQPKEKQSLLVATAPVMSPSVHLDSPGQQPQQRPSRDQQRQLRKLDNDYRLTKQRAAFQKEQAARFLERQAERMVLHTGSVERVMVCCAEHEQAVVDTLRSLAKRVRTFRDAMKAGVAGGVAAPGAPPPLAEFLASLAAPPAAASDPLRRSVDVGVLARATQRQEQQQQQQDSPPPRRRPPTVYSRGAPSPERRRSGSGSGVGARGGGGGGGRGGGGGSAGGRRRDSGSAGAGRRDSGSAGAGRRDSAAARRAAAQRRERGFR